MPYRRTGSDKWYINVKGVRRSSGTDSYTDAKALEDKLNHEVWLQEKMGIKPPKPWEAAVNRWLDEKAGKISIQDDIERLKWLDQFLWSVPDICLITRDQIDTIMQLRKGVSTIEATSQNATANKYVAMIAAILHAAEREWAWGNRAPRLRYYKVLTNVGRALTVEEWNRLQPQLPPLLRRAATFALATGMRAGKVYGLRWDQISLRPAQLSFRGTGNKLGNTIPLNKTALGVIESIKQDKVVHATNVFTWGGRPVDSYGDAWLTALKRAKVERIRFHDLRVTFNTWLAEKGVPEQIQKRLLGHSTNQVHDRYTMLNVEHLRPYSEMIDTLLTQSGGETGDNQLSKVG